MILFSGGKDSTLLVHLAVKAFAPAPVPFPLLHVDTGHNYPEVIDFRDRLVGALGLRLEVAHVQDWIDDGRLVERPDGTRNPLQTVPLLDSITEHRFDAVFGGGRRDEERARAKERIISLRDAFGRWDPRSAAPRAVEPLQRPARPRRARPGVPDLQLDRAGRLALHPARERRAAVDLLRPRARRCSAATACGSPRGRGAARAAPRSWRRRRVRYRTVGDGSCTGAVESAATTLDEIIAEVTASRLTERGATRADDRLSEAAMEDRKREGYF